MSAWTKCWDPLGLGVLRSLALLTSICDLGLGGRVGDEESATTSVTQTLPLPRSEGQLRFTWPGQAQA